MPRFFPKGMIWRMPVTSDNAVYLTFDDGPHPEITPWVMSQLDAYGAKATFFCVGNNVVRFPHVYENIALAGHTTGNHTYNHLNGWKTNTDHYLRNIAQAGRHIEGHLFRPPYGRMRLSQYRRLLKRDLRTRVYMWDILSGDFDNSLSPQQCTNNVLQHITPGAIIVFHDSEKAWPRLQETLPAVLAHCAVQGWAMRALPGNT